MISLVIMQRSGRADRTPQVHHQVLAQVLAPARVLHRKLWLPRYTRIAPHRFRAPAR